MVKNAFLITCGVILGALAIENKQYFSHQIPVPVAVLPDAGVYEGDLDRGLFGGQGRITWPDESYYEGEFEQGLFQGKGILHTKHYLYEGEFEAGHASGEGVITYSNGDKYQGEVSHGLPDGQGVLETASSTYKGEFKESVYHGQGELTDNTGVRYVGGFENGLFHGEGVYVQQNTTPSEGDEAEVGVVYRGNFVAGEFTGEGEWLNGDERYEGEFRRWLFHGKGVYSDPQMTYTGEFVDGAFEGAGQYTDIDGLTYEGNFQGGRYHGKGALVTPLDGTYTGEFQYGRKHGKGVLVFTEPLDGVEQIQGRWLHGELVESDQPGFVFDRGELVEHALYHQSDLISDQLEQLQDNDAENIDLYFVGIAGDGSQGVFRREVNYVRTLFDESYGTKNKSLTLINSPVTHTTIPLATVTSIEETLQGVAAKMDAKNDILFVYLTSHGSTDFDFYLSQPGLALADLSANKLGEILKELPVRHKVVVISACYSGGFIAPLKSDATMVITAAQADRASFGCRDQAKMTYFGEAYFKDSLHQSGSFVEAFTRARDIVKGREAKEGFENSNPLIYKPKAILAQLEKWREQLQKENIEPLIPATTPTPP